MVGGVDVEDAPLTALGAIAQLVESRVKVESTMFRPDELMMDVELAVSFRLGRPGPGSRSRDG